MATVNDLFNPSFVLFPLNNNRTAWRPIGFPIILVEPFKRSTSGATFVDADLKDVAITIEDAPQQARVAGLENRGLLVPQLERFRVEIPRTTLIRYKIDPLSRPFFNAAGNPKSSEDAVDGDLFEYTTTVGEITDTITYIKSADYYDMSVFLVNTGPELPDGRYKLVYSGTYLSRVQSRNSELLCFGDESLLRRELDINHPGEVLREMVMRTPPDIYITGKLDKDETVAFYRPIADVLQDIFDEQEVFRGINFIDSIPAQLIPYLAYLIGWDLPYLPENFANRKDDAVRRAILKRAVALQKLKGTRQALLELFEILGFTATLTNLWFTLDGKQVIGPDEELPPELSGFEIRTQNLCRIDPLISNFNDSGFGLTDDENNFVEIPLLYRPNLDFSLHAWLVEDGSDLQLALQSAVDSLLDNPDIFSSDSCLVTADGIVTPQPLLDVLPSDIAIGLSELVVSLDTGLITDELHTNEKLLSSEAITFNRVENKLKLVFDHHLDFSTDVKLYVFASYRREKIIVPTALQDYQSNRFDINITLKDGETIPANVFDFLLDQLFGLKAFHSLLRKIIFNIDLPEVYNVQDFCLGGSQKQDPNLDAGKLQVPGAIIPLTPPEGEDCSPELSLNLGYKNEDLALRELIINGLEAEHALWKEEKDQRAILEELSASELAELQSLSNLSTDRFDSSNDCRYNPLGQDRIALDPDIDLDHEEDTRAQVCSLNPPLPDYCYKGRVQGELEEQRIMLLEEHIRCKPCPLGMGLGVYFSIEYTTDDITLDTFFPPFITAKCGVADIIGLYDSWACKYNTPENESIHFSDREYIIPQFPSHREFLALRRPSLQIEKDNMFIPGHRFVTMNKLLLDFVHPSYRARPWDYTSTCNYDAIRENPLNARLEVGSDGVEEFLVFDDDDLIYPGNGMEPDISSLGEHDPRTFSVTHKIYTTADSSHPAISGFDTLEETSLSEVDICPESF